VGLVRHLLHQEEHLHLQDTPWVAGPRTRGCPGRCAQLCCLGSCGQLRCSPCPKPAPFQLQPLDASRCSPSTLCAAAPTAPGQIQAAAYTSPVSNNTFQYASNLSDFTTGTKGCNLLGGHLASYVSQEEQADVEQVGRAAGRGIAGAAGCLAG
jgi:hypothetical protein